jgi:hypothetical protein
LNLIEKTRRNSVESPFGRMDLYRLLQDSKGIISFNLYDSGTMRQSTSRYGFKLNSDNKLEIWPASNNGSKLTIEQYIELDPSKVVFAGLYIGDGAKASHTGSASVVSFSQRESHIANFVRNEFLNLFGKSLTFTHRVNEDALFFMTEDMRHNLARLREDLIKEGLTDLISNEELDNYLKRDLESVIKEQPSATKAAVTKYSKKKGLQKFQKYLVEFFAYRQIMKIYLERLKMKELAETGTPLSPNDRITANIRLPGVKGAREAGKSSRSDELDVDGFSPFHTLFLRIISDIQTSIEQNIDKVCVTNSDAPWLEWNGKPHEYCAFSLLTKEYFQQAKGCGRPSRSKFLRYSIKEKETVLEFEWGKFKFLAPKRIKFTPLVCLFFGLYLAEGQTPKKKVFQFSTEAVGSLNVGFTASEPDSVSICMMAMRQLIIGEKSLPEYWRIKIGAKYVPETVTIGNKIGSVALRRGEKGQGAASGFEIVDSLREWTIQSMPALYEIKSRFDHAEYTGAGIPRIDLFYPKGYEIYLFAIMRDILTCPENLNNYSEKPQGAIL